MFSPKALMVSRVLPWWPSSLLQSVKPARADDCPSDPPSLYAPFESARSGPPSPPQQRRGRAVAMFPSFASREPGHGQAEHRCGTETKGERAIGRCGFATRG